MLSVEGKGSSLPLDSTIHTSDQQLTTVREELAKKHPPGQPAHGDTLVPSTAQNHDIHPVLFECTDGDTVWNAALHTNGSAGPSGLDTIGWKCLCTSFQNLLKDSRYNYAILTTSKSVWLTEEVQHN